ncbi:hypothetical protein SAMN05442782_2210 [Streptomyces sp. OK228]|nr:hypothetical protein SAMN05442782_2210 [Streptomyces sp. OK228]
MLGDRTRGLTVFAGTRDPIPPTAAALRNGPTCPHSPSTHEADGQPHVHPRLPTPEGRAARPDPGPQYFPHRPSRRRVVRGPQPDAAARAGPRGALREHSQTQHEIAADPDERGG